MPTAVGMGTGRAVPSLSPTPDCGAPLQELHPLQGWQEFRSTEQCCLLCTCLQSTEGAQAQVSFSGHCPLLSACARPCPDRAQLALPPLLLSPEVWVTHL